MYYPEYVYTLTNTVDNYTTLMYVRVCIQTQNKEAFMRKTHGESKTRLFRIWQRIRSEGARDPWGRDSVCTEWATDYASFKSWAESSGYTETSVLKRYSKYEGYSSANCYWLDGERRIKEDIIGKTFGKLSVLREVPKSDRKPGRRLYVCKCSCGNEATVQSNNLLSGATKSCGCLRNHAAKIRAEDNGNLRVGRLTIIERFDDDSVVKYRCLCDCGNMVGVPASDLFSGRVTSCGCTTEPVQQSTPVQPANPLADWDNF